MTDSLPFKYLGILIGTVKLRAIYCKALIDKMVVIIRNWSTRNLSLARRSQLVQSVLMSVHRYCAQIFMLPSSVIKAINTICIYFLWTGKANGLVLKGANLIETRFFLPKIMVVRVLILGNGTRQQLVN